LPKGGASVSVEDIDGVVGRRICRPVHHQQVTGGRIASQAALELAGGGQKRNVASPKASVTIRAESDQRLHDDYLRWRSDGKKCDRNKYSRYAQ
jgi:hypothetical protein